MAEAREGERVREDTSARWIGWIGIVAGIWLFSLLLYFLEERLSF